MTDLEGLGFELQTLVPAIQSIHCEAINQNRPRYRGKATEDRIWRSEGMTRKKETAAFERSMKVDKARGSKRQRGCTTMVVVRWSVVQGWGGGKDSSMKMDLVNGAMRVPV